MLAAVKDALMANGPAALALGGGAIGFALGWLLFATNFCAMGAISDLMNFGDWRRFRAWVLAAAVALIGTQALAAAGVVDLGKSMYLAPTLDWAGNLAGGFLFGIGMIYAGGCASKNLVRAGSGDLRSAVVLMVLGLFAYMAIGGLLGPLRAELTRLTAIPLGRAATQGLGDLVGAATGLGTRATLPVAGLLALAALIYCFADRAFRSSNVHVGSGVGVGLLAIAGWALTGLAFDDMVSRPTAPISLTYVRPMGDTLEWLQRFTAGPMPGFGVTSTLGVLAGACAASLRAGRFRLTTFANPSDTLRNMGGAALMGIGGVMALGCTIGQAVTGVSTLALGSLLTFGALVAGGVAGMKLLERGLANES